jgi:AcrR family transcriptional regulator
VTEPEPGLRERKRRATRLTIQQVALRLALEQGLAAVTVDEISRRADISPRTFFNYFPSKEQALLGDDPTLPDEQAVEAFVAGGSTGDLLTDVGRLLVKSTQELLDERELVPERHELLRAHPQLFTQRMASMKEFQGALAAVIERRLRADGDTPEGEIERRSRLASLVTLATMRHAWSEWSSAEDDAHLVDFLESSFADLGSLVSRSLV